MLTQISIATSTHHWLVEFLEENQFGSKSNQQPCEFDFSREAIAVFFNKERDSLPEHQHSSFGTPALVLSGLEESLYALPFSWLPGDRTNLREGSKLCGAH